MSPGEYACVMAGDDAPTVNGGPDDHSTLRSELDSHNLAFATGVGDASKPVTVSPGESPR